MHVTDHFWHTEADLQGHMHSGQSPLRAQKTTCWSQGLTDLWGTPHALGESNSCHHLDPQNLFITRRKTMRVDVGENDRVRTSKNSLLHESSKKIDDCRNQLL